MPDFIPRKDSAALAWMARLVAGLEEDPAAFGLDSADLASANAALAAFRRSLPESVRAQKHARGAVTQKNSDRDAMEREGRLLARRVHASREVPDATKLKLGLKVRTRSHQSKQPQEPLGLVAIAHPSGPVELKWGGNGNRPGTVYLIESRRAGTEPWTLIDVETRTKYTHKSGVPAGRISYRIIAKRNGVTSGSSNVAEVYAAQLDAAA